MTLDIGRKLGAVGKILIAMMVFATVAITTTGSASASAASTSAVTAVQPATTATDSHGCAAHSLCLWVNSGFSGGQVTFTFGTVTSDVWHPIDHGINDEASSLDNNRADESGIDKNSPANLPDFFCFSGGTTISNFAGQSWPDGSSLNDSASSYQLSSHTSSCTTPS